VDVTDEASVGAMAATAVDRFGSVDILVNNAGLMAEVMGQKLTTVPMEMWHRTLAVNLTGPLLCTRAVVPRMKEKGYGKIINQSSGGAFLPSAHYGASKLGLVSMTLSLAHELAPHGIRVNAIAPGWVNTEAGLSTTPPEIREAIGAAIPFPFADPEELVGGLVYLASAASDWVTGHTLNIDGGWIPRV
jgi:NAD(P)-dependent dehydrogenase (short-subunit alcohol dehydrogenase family)